jgi:hypothetical protein
MSPVRTFYTYLPGFKVEHVMETEAEGPPVVKPDPDLLPDKDTPNETPKKRTSRRSSADS